MSKKIFNLEIIHDFMEGNVMPDWVILRDHQKELARNNEEYDPFLVSRLGEILELFSEKEYRKGLVNYVSWLKDYDGFLYPDDMAMFKDFAEYIGLDPHILESVIIKNRKY